MTKEFKEKINKVITEYWSNPDVLNLGDYDVAMWLFAHIFNQRGYVASFEGVTSDMSDTINELQGLYDQEYAVDEDFEIVSPDYPLIIPNNLNKGESIKNIIKEYYKEGYFIKPSLFITKEFLLCLNGYVFFTKSEIPERFSNCYVTFDNKDRFFGYVSCGRSGFRTTNMKIKELCTDDNFFDNYNEDLPWDGINNFIKSDYSGLILLHGCPGSGKTTAIRHMIATNVDTKFYWLDQSMLSQVNNSEFLDFLMEHKNSVFILEDCEILLQSRDKGGNGLINTLLNMSDGILGDSLNIKFICTFNTNINNIDKALQRKGRLKLQYEFKPLKKERVQKLFDSIGIKEEAKEMPLCEVYNYKVNNIVGEKTTRKIGF